MSEPTWRPRLRSDVEVVRDDAGQATALLDPPLGRRIPVGRLTAALVDLFEHRHEDRLDGEDCAALIAAAGEATGARSEEVEEALRTLLLLNLFEGAGAQGVARLRAIAAGDEDLTPQVLPDARFGCRGSGQCCHVFRPGPLSDEDLAALAAATPALQEALPDLPATPWTEEREGRGEGGSGERWRYLRRRAGRCLFLRPDGRCGVHAVAGPAAKPAFCRLFPFDVVRTVRGVRLFDVTHCSSQAEAAQQGPAHAEHAADLAPLLPRRPRLFHPLVLLDGGQPCDYLHLLPLEDRLLERAEERGPAPGAQLRALAALARSYAAALAACPLDPAAPEAATAAALARDRAGETPPLPAAAPEAAARAIAAVMDALIAAAEAEGERDAPLAAAFVDAAGAARSLAAEAAGLAAGPLPAALRRAAALPIDAGAAAALWRSSLLNRLFGSRLLVAGRLRAGVLRVACLFLLTGVAARLRAAVGGASRVEARHLSEGHWLSSLALARPQVARALLAVEHHVWVVAAAAPDVIEG